MKYIIWIVVVVCIVILFVYYYITKYKTNPFLIKMEEFQNKKEGDILFPSIFVQKKKLHANIRLSYRYPIIIIPDIGENKIYGKWVLPESVQTTYKKIWYCEESNQVETKKGCLWKHIFIPTFEDSGLQNKKDVKVTSYRYTNYTSSNDLKLNEDFGSIRSLDIGLHTKVDTHNWKGMTTMLQYELGYKDTSSLFCAPYDFRCILNHERFEEYSKLCYKLIKYTQKKYNTSIIFITKGFGSLLFLMVMNKIFRDPSLYVKHWISINALFNGCEYASKSINKGISQSIGIYASAYGTAEQYKELYSHMSSVYSLCCKDKKLDGKQKQEYLEAIQSKYSKYIMKGLKCPQTIVYPKKIKHFKQDEFLFAPKKWMCLNELTKENVSIFCKQWGDSYKNIESIIHHLKTLLIHINISGQQTLFF